MTGVAPRAGREAAPHWQAARDGRLLLPFDRTGAPVWPPGAEDLDWRECPGEGEVASYSIVRRPLSPDWRDKAPYCVAMIQLGSGHRLLANLVDCDPAQVRIGLRVTCGFRETADPELGLVIFRPTKPAS